MTTAHDSVDPTASRADELEDWLTDLRINLSDDPPGWITPDDDIDDRSPEPSAKPPTGKNRPEQETGTADRSTNPGQSLKADPPRPAPGRHRAAEQ